MQQLFCINSVYWYVTFPKQESFLRIIQHVEKRHNYSQHQTETIICTVSSEFNGIHGVNVEPKFWLPLARFFPVSLRRLSGKNAFYCALYPSRRLGEHTLRRVQLCFAESQTQVYTLLKPLIKIFKPAQPREFYNRVYIPRDVKTRDCTFHCRESRMAELIGE